MKFKKIAYYLSLITCLSFWAIKPLLATGFFPMHDDTQVARVQQMAQALKDGQFPVRWVGDLGYGFGYPIFNFYAPLAYYVGAFFNLIGFNVLVATKMMFGLGIVLSGFSMFFLAREFWGKRGGLVAAVFYVYAPYHAVDIYVRGAAGELWAMVFLPLVFLGFYRRRFLLAAVSLTAVILSHNLTALMLLPFLFLILLVLFIFQKDKKKFGVWSLEFGVLAVGLSAFYWLPALTEMGLTKVFGQVGGGADWQDHFVFLDQLWSSPWGFAGSAPGRLDGMSFMIGKLHVIVALAGLIALRRVWLLIPFFGFLIAVFLTTNYSAFVWQAVPIMAFIQYPWRFLIFAIFASSFIAGSAVSWWSKKFKWWPAVATGFLVGGLLIFNIKYFQSQAQTTVDYLQKENIKWATSKISDEYLPKDFPVPETKEAVAWEKVVVAHGKAEIKNQKIKSHRYDFEVIANEPVEILVNTAYFPGWQVWLDNSKIQPEIDTGKIKLAVLSGRHQVKLKFINTPIRTLANLISLVTLAGLIYFFKKR